MNGPAVEGPEEHQEEEHCPGKHWAVLVVGALEAPQELAAFHARESAAEVHGGPGGPRGGENGPHPWRTRHCCCPEGAAAAGRRPGWGRRGTQPTP